MVALLLNGGAEDIRDSGVSVQMAGGFTGLRGTGDLLVKGSRMLAEPTALFPATDAALRRVWTPMVVADRLSHHGPNLPYRDRMPETFEVDRVDRIADILFGVATAKGLIGYGPLAKRVETRPDFLSQPLEKVSRRAFDKGEPLWSALVVSRDTARPSSGFYGLARKMRPEYAALSDDELWQQERERCYQAAS